eukprot:COSAG02_NODE_21403_length_789_cov_1.272464_1_plen_224_part_10
MIIVQPCSAQPRFKDVGFNLLLQLRLALHGRLTGATGALGERCDTSRSMIHVLHGRARWMFAMGAAMVMCSALSAMLWIGLLDLSRPSIVAQTPQITPMHAALQAVFDDGLAAAGAAEYGLTHQGPLRPDGTINLVGQGGIDGQAGGFRVHKRSPFGSGVDHTMDEDGIDFIELPEVKPAKYIDPHAEQGVQWSGALVQLMEQGYAREDAQAALSSTGNDLEAS